MSCWTDQWKDFVRKTSYKQTLAAEKISNDQFWSSYGIYDRALLLAGYPGEILGKISSLISPNSTLLDIGAGTGAFAIPLSKKTSRTIAVDPSDHQLQILMEKARQEGLDNILAIKKEWKDVLPSDISAVCSSGEDAAIVDYSLAAYSLFDENIECFLSRMIDIARKGVFIVFRGGGVDSLNEFAYGRRPYADYICLDHILSDLGYRFDRMLFTRNYSLPVDLVFKQYRFCKKSPEQLLGHLDEEDRLIERSDGKWASFQATDALLYLNR
ncbi:MAG: class I SAM-dependent methyltransferase [Methanothrix sp.]|nr:class I SAM-dependent methyltransferase [Methanothrix sp.]